MRLVKTKKIVEILDGDLLDLAAVPVTAPATAMGEAVRLGTLKVAGLGLGNARESLPRRRRWCS